MFESPCYTAKWYKSVTCHECCIWKPACQKQVSRAGISIHIPDTVERNYLSLPLVTASGTQVTLYSATILPQFTVHLAQPMPHLIQGRHQRLWHVSLILSCTKRPLWLLSIYSRYFSITQCCSSRQLVVTKWERNHLITVYSIFKCMLQSTHQCTHRNSLQKTLYESKYCQIMKLCTFSDFRPCNREDIHTCHQPNIVMYELYGNQGYHQYQLAFLEARKHQ